MRRHRGAGPVRLHAGYQTARIGLCPAIEHAAQPARYSNLKQPLKSFNSQMAVCFGGNELPLTPASRKPALICRQTCQEDHAEEKNIPTQTTQSLTNNLQTDIRLVWRSKKRANDVMWTEMDFAQVEVCSE
ncbi:hypothetical protein DPX16_12631 [Anabarilius grahami]|uniref:Uncharacterized protein n=1 Tax=Anabarilius grahami TaxID=495550 RepID=A0A3N0YLX8_ANAGA|nr:hypothetical protein DPX16_12631 [Anabarilius grahami]